MNGQDFSKRLVIVVRKDLVGWQATNTVAHIAAYVGNKLKDSFGTGEFFVTLDKKEFPRNSQYPMIIKSANSSEQLSNVLAKAREEKLMHHAFIREMIDTTSDEEIEKTLSSKAESEVEILGVGIFGSHEQVNSLTKKFSLWN